MSWLSKQRNKGANMKSKNTIKVGHLNTIWINKSHDGFMVAFPTKKAALSRKIDVASYAIKYVLAEKK